MATRWTMVVTVTWLGAVTGAARAAPQVAPSHARPEAARNRTAGEAFLAKNGARAGVVTLASGLQYEILKAGDGRRPSLHDTVVVHYRGALVDGTELGSSYASGRPGTFPVRAGIPGWREALQLMPTGSRWRLVVPPHLAFGERGAGAVGPHATLVYEVELLSVKGLDAGRASTAPDLRAIEVSYRVDPRLTRSLWLGDRWVSPARFTPSLQGKTAMFEASARGVDASGARVAIEPEWTPVDPEMVQVTRRRGGEVSITVKRPGETKLAVRYQGITSELAVKASSQGDALAVEVRQ